MMRPLALVSEPACSEKLVSAAVALEDVIEHWLLGLEQGSIALGQQMVEGVQHQVMVTSQGENLQ